MLRHVADGAFFCRRLMTEWVALELRKGSRRIDDLDPRWFSSIMFAGRPNVVSDAQPVDTTRGTTDRARFSLRYAESVEGPSSVFVKIAPEDRTSRIFGSLLSLGQNEVRFYRELAHETAARVPRSFGAHIDERTGAFALVLEDLVAHHARFATIQTQLDESDVVAVLDALATLHAAFWRSPRFESDLSWTCHHRDEGRERIGRFVSAAAHGPTVKKYATLLSDRTIRQASNIHPHRAALEALWASEPRTLIHGDCHAGNLFFVDGAAGLFDWQVVQHGQGMRDVAYFLITSVGTELRRSRQREWLGHYLEALGRRGVPADDLDFATMWKRYRGHALYAWIATSVTASLSTLQPEPIRRLGLRRADAALVDLDAFSVLDVDS